MKKLTLTWLVLLVAASFLSANPIPVPPPASMPLEDMKIVIRPSGSGLQAAFTGDFTFTYIPEDVNAMLFPLPPDTNGIRVWQDPLELEWRWSDQQYPTVLPEMPNIPMIEWQGPFPAAGAVFRVDYRHELIRRPQEFIFFYAVGTGKYFPTYEKTTTAHFDIAIPAGFGVAGVWHDLEEHEYEIVDSHLKITVRSQFGPITKDLIVSLKPKEGPTDFTDFALLADHWLRTDCDAPCWCGGADRSCNGTVDTNDLEMLAENWLVDKESGGPQKPNLSAYYLPVESAIIPDAPGYTLPLDLETVTNKESLAPFFDLTGAAPLLEQNGFAVVEYDLPSLDYEGDDIVKPYEQLCNFDIPIFVTSDTLLHLYHVQFDETLKNIEETQFYFDIRDLTAALLKDALTRHGQFTGDLKEAAKRNVAYLAVAHKLIDPNNNVPPLVAELAAEELDKIEAHAGFEASDIFIYMEDYSQYVPRGHYTRSERLKCYFKTLMWYGRMAFLLKGSIPWGPAFAPALISPYDAKIQTTEAVLLANAIQYTQVGPRSGRALWDRIYAVTAFYVGLADDLTPCEYLWAVHKVFGSGFEPDDLNDEARFFNLKIELALMRSPKINGGTGYATVVPPVTEESLNNVLDKTKGMRFMGQRFIPDSYMFQHLVFPEVGPYLGSSEPKPFTCGKTGICEGCPFEWGRCYPTGLDVMAVLGSARAQAILAEEGDTDYEDYAKKLKDLKTEFDSFDLSDWNRNLYLGWLYSLGALLQECPEGYPGFMRTDAWENKQLNAALASWTELRHDTILYAKQSYTPPGTTSVPDPPAGYVEPVPEFYGRLLALTRMTRKGLTDLDALPDRAALRLVNLESLLARLIEIADKQLRNETLSQDDNSYLRDFAATLETTVLGVDDKGIKTTLVADVHTHGFEGNVVEEGVGKVDLIVVACPMPSGHVFLAVGPVLSYYEFKHPMNDRLTDEAWRELLARPDKPDRPPWFKSLMP